MVWTMDHVVVGVDESDGAAIALRFAIEEGSLHGWAVTAVMAWGFLDQHHTIVGERFDPSYGEGDALAVLDEIVTKAVGDVAAAQVERRVICDLAARALLEASAGSELLVVGGRGLGGFRGLLLGSVSQHCLHHATTPVAVVRDFDTASKGGVVVAVDGSDTAQRALEWAVEEARLRQARLRVVNAWHQPFAGGLPYPDGLFEPGIVAQASEAILDQALGGCDLGDLEVDRVSAEGTPAGVVLEAASSAELVVTGSRGLGGFKGLLLGSTTNQVAHHATCPLIVVPPGQ